MLSGQGGLILEIKCPCARKTWHERGVGVFLKWAYFRRTTVHVVTCKCICHPNLGNNNNHSKFRCQTKVGIISGTMHVATARMVVIRKVPSLINLVLGMRYACTCM